MKEAMSTLNTVLKKPQVPEDDFDRYSKILANELPEYPAELSRKIVDLSPSPMPKKRTKKTSGYIDSALTKLDNIERRARLEKRMTIWSVDSTYTNSVYTPQANTPLSSFSEATPQASRKRKINQRKDKGNIRRRHVAEWKDNKRKMLRNLGKEYESRDGTVRCGKSLGPTCQ
ncbi:unnamed protein product [Pieris macdunnoughi]|uniref:Uncharacterized protein n=1 Tax=Pieris macdunnoughi TaxID=345717 RepID=A0A821UJR4_9NEOP|nr:unnamed protein product [Pieris macdunnoughi]